MLTSAVVFLWSLQVSAVGGSCAADTSLGMSEDSSNTSRMTEEVFASRTKDENWTNVDSSSHNDDDTFLWTILVSLFLATCIAGLAGWIIHRRAFVEIINKLPGPSLNKNSYAATEPHPWLGHLGAFMDLKGENHIPNYPGMTRSYDNLVAINQQFQADGLFRLWIFHPFRVPFAQPIILVTDIHLVQQLLTDKSITRLLIKQPDIYKLSRALVGDSYLTLPDTPKWKHQRKLTALGMHHSLLEQANAVVVDLLYNKVFPKWDQEGTMKNPTVTREAGGWCVRFVSDVLGKVAFSRSFGGLEDEDSKEINKQTTFYLYQKLIFLITRRSQRPKALQPFQLEENREFNQCEQALNSIIQTIVEERLLAKQQQPKPEQLSDSPQTACSSELDGKFHDLLSYMIQDDDKEHQLSKKELVGNVRLILFAGQDTTAITLSHALHELAVQPLVQKRLQKEVDSLFVKVEQPQYKDIMQLEYLDAVVKESLRLHAPVGVARQNIQDITLSKADGTDYFIPKGSPIYVYPFLTCQGNGSPQMQTFVPERFLKDCVTGSKPELPYAIPFSVGPRNCVGQPLATAELKVILAHLVHRYTIRKTLGSDDPIKMCLITVKAHQIMIDFDRR